MERKSWIAIGIAVGFVVVLFYAGVFTYIGESTGLVVGVRSCEDMDGLQSLEEQKNEASYAKETQTYDRESGRKVVSKNYHDKCDIQDADVIEQYCDGYERKTIELNCEHGCRLGACNPGV